MQNLKYLISFVLVCFMLCGFSLKPKPKAFIVFSSNPVNQSTLSNTEVCFKEQQKIYYMIYNPNGFQDDFIRIQVVKKDDKTNIGGYKIKYTNDVEVKLNSKVYCDALILHEKGIYFMQVNEFKEFNKALAYGTFEVVE